MNADLAERLWRLAEPTVFVSREQYLKSFDGWTVNEVKIDGKPAFVTMVRGPEFHFASLNTGARISMQMIREFLKPIVAEYGHAITRTPKGDLRQDRFNRRIGFSAIGTDEFNTIYRIRRLPHG
jgi:hypothetical protein